MSYSYIEFLTQKALLLPEEVAELQPLISHKELAQDEYLLRPGEVCEHLFFVEKGLIRTYTIGENGKEHILNFAPENWLVADRSSIYFKEPSEIFIQAIEPTTLTVINEQFLNKANEISFNFSKFNERALHRHIYAQQLRINLLLSATAEQRYLKFIETYFDLTLRVPQWMIASYLGITPESLSRVRKELARRHKS